MVECVRKRFDKRRAGYYYANIARKWNDYNNYNIMLDSSTPVIDGFATVLKGLLSY